MEVYYLLHNQYILFDELRMNAGKQRLDQLEKLMYIKYQEWIQHLSDI